MKIHFLPGQSNYRERLKRDAKSGHTEWTCPKNAEIDDTVFILILGEGVLATGTVDSVPRPAPKGWGFSGRYHAEISNLELLPAPVSMDSLVRRFPKWGYPTYPRSYATVQSPLAKEIIRFIALRQSAIVDDLPLPLLSVERHNILSPNSGSVTRPELIVKTLENKRSCVQSASAIVSRYEFRYSDTRSSNATSE